MPGNGNGALAAAAFSGFAMQMFNKAIPSFATGGDFVTSGPQLMMVGDNPTGVERVQVTPLGGAPESSGGGITVNMSGNVMSEDFIEDKVVDILSKLKRQGYFF